MIRDGNIARSTGIRMVFISLLLSLALLVGIIYALRRYQERAIVESVDRNQPLPPLESGRAATRRAPEEPEAGLAGEEEISSAGVTPQALPSDWVQRCRGLREEGRHDAAMELARQAYPRWQGWVQRAMVYRSRIREAQQHGAEPGPELDALYLAAARASFLHDRDAGLPVLGSARLQQLVPEQTLEELEMPYGEIGYRELRILNKSDRALLREYRGEPERHQSARGYHRQWWLERLQPGEETLS